MNLFALLGKFLWVPGLAILVAYLGWCHWQSRLGDRYLKFNFPKLILDMGAILFCLGGFLAVGQLWLRILFVCLAFSFMILSICDSRMISKEPD